jgi:2-isopropylmalate synthase
MSDRIQIFDTTLRDGEQAPGCQLNTVEKIEIARQLESLGVDAIEAGFPISSPGDFQSVVEVSKAVTTPVICALTRAVEKDIDAAVEALKFAKRGRVHTGIGASDIHIKHKFNSTREEVLKRAVAAVKYARKSIEEIEFYAEDAGRADNAFLAQMIEAVIAAGATYVNIPDTTGYCTPWEFGAKIKYLVEHVKDIDKAIISVHCHNDLGLATANTLAGIQNGARQAQVTINGIGERAGNTSLEEIAMILKTRKDLDAETGIDTTQITPASRLVSRLMRMPVQANKAIVGRNAFGHSSGIHQDGVLKDRSTYEIMRPEDVGIKDNTIDLSARSGRAALKHHLERLGYKITPAELVTAYQKFLVVADRKKQLGDDDLRLLMGDLAAGGAIEVEMVQVFSGFPITPMATVRLMVNGSEHHATATGNGPVDAAFSAVNSIIQKPVILEEYLVQAITTGSDDTGKVHVQLAHENNLYYGFGAHTDIVVASVKAYVDALGKIA